jgi:hypothetical protein
MLSSAQKIIKTSHSLAQMFSTEASFYFTPTTIASCDKLLPHLTYSWRTIQGTTPWCSCSTEHLLVASLFQMPGRQEVERLADDDRVFSLTRPDYWTPSWFFKCLSQSMDLHGIRPRMLLTFLAFGWLAAALDPPANIRFSSS